MKEVHGGSSLPYQSYILNTKLHIPTKPPSLLARPRLNNKLEEIFKKKVIAISAPAGFGKTALISEWVRRKDLSVAWVSLDRSENDPMRFWTYIFAAIEKVNIGVSTDIYTLLESAQLSSVETVIIPFIQEVSKIPSSFILVLDDFHVIEDSLIHRAISYLIRYLPGNLKIVLTSRTEIPLSLYRLHLDNQIVEIGSDDLRFTKKEIRTFFNQLNGFNLSFQELKLLEKYTEGWIVGMQLLSLTMGKKKNVSDFIKSFPGSNMHISEYLTGEVLNHHSPNIKDFMLKVSILDRMCGSLCRAVTGEENAGVTLSELFKENSFIFPLDDEEYWYRYHHFFRNMLNRRLLEEWGENVCLIHDRAAHWFEKHGYIQEAIHHSFEAKNYEKATILIDEIAPDIIKRREFSTMKNWIEQFPEKWLDKHPDLCVINSWVLALTGWYSKAELSLLKAETYINGAQRKQYNHVLVEIDVIRGYLSIVQKDSEKTVQYMQSSISRQPKYSRFLQFGMVLNPGEPFLLSSDLGLNGSLTKVYTIYTELRKIWKFSGLPIVGHGSTILGELYYEWNQLEEVNYFVNRGIQIGEDNRNIGILLPIYFIRAKIKKIHNMRTETWAIIEDIERKVTEWKVSSHWRDTINAFKTELFIDEGRMDEVQYWLQTSGMSIEDKITDATEYQYIIYARALYSVGETRDSLELMDKLLDLASAEDRLATIINLLFIKSLILFNDRKKKQSYKLINTILDIAEPEGYIRTFLDKGTEAFNLFSEYSKHGNITSKKNEKYLSRLLRIFEEEIGIIENKSNKDLADPLTNRELEILSLLDEGLSNKEIADRLYITIGTVKGYTHTIYMKLQVKNRTRALVEAKMIGLL